LQTVYQPVIKQVLINILDFWPKPIENQAKTPGGPSSSANLTTLGFSSRISLYHPTPSKYNKHIDAQLSLDCVVLYIPRSQISRRPSPDICIICSKTICTAKCSPTSLNVSNIRSSLGLEVPPSSQKKCWTTYRRPLPFLEEWGPRSL
jgi:hypothetical protein